MRIAIISPDWPDFVDGGVATLSLALARGLVGMGSEVQVWTRGGGRRMAAIRARARSDRAHPFTVHGVAGRSWRRNGDRHWRRGLAAALPGFQPDAVVVTTWEPLEAVAAAFASLAPDRRPRIAVMAHGRDVTADPGVERREQRERAFEADVLWLVLTDWMASQLQSRGVSPERVVTVPAAVLEVPKPAPRSQRRATTLLTVGRLIPRKGQDVVIEAIALLGEREPALHYLVVGDGPDRDRLLGLVEAHGLQDRVRLTGWLEEDELEKIWQQADLFVMPAREERGGDTEGYGLVFLEAGARGLPVVGGRSGGVPAAVRSGENGELVDQPQEAVAVAGLISSLLSDPQTLSALGAGGRRRYELGGRPVHLGRVVQEALQRPQGGC